MILGCILAFLNMKFKKFSSTPAAAPTRCHGDDDQHKNAARDDQNKFPRAEALEPNTKFYFWKLEKFKLLLHDFRAPHLIWD